MSKKPKFRGPSQPTDLRTRLRKATSEGRFQAALELARQLYKEQPTPEHLKLVRDSYLGRVRQLRSQGHTRDAAATLQASLAITGEDGPWLGVVVEEFLACGDVAKALELLTRCPEEVRPRVLGRAADAAMQQDAAGRKLLPAELHADFDRILQAFSHVEAGRDDEAREALAGIGLRSPFLEWKLLLRGMQAYYQNDDVRALENWQRLNPDRLPARLAAPLRFLVDREYRTAQVPETQHALQKQADRLQSSPLVTQLRELQQAMTRDESLKRTFQLAETIAAQLRAESPQLRQRLATCMYWSIITMGGPEDVPRYQRVFGQPADDPGFHRLRALALEHAHDYQRAHEEWQKFEKSIAANPAAWPGPEAARARALVWEQMGHNAEAMADLDSMPRPRFAFFEEPKRKLSPSAEECFKKAVELAPDDLHAHQTLFHYYQEDEKTAKAIKAGLALLKQHPNHAATLADLGKLYMEEENYVSALDAYQQAQRANPLDRELRGNICTAHLFQARSLAEAGQFEEARKSYQASLALETGDKSSALCKWSACEFKAGDVEKAEELLKQALAASANNRLAIAFSMLIEVIRLKLPRTLKTRFDKEFKEALAEPPTAEGAAAVAHTAAVHRLANVKYTGQKSHESKALAYLKKAEKLAFREGQFEKLCADLIALQAKRLTQTFLEKGQREFPKNPFFLFLEAETHFVKGPERFPSWRVQPLLENARRLAEALPRDDRVKRLLEQIQERERMLATLNPFLSMMGGAFGPFEEYEEFDDDYEDEF